jgi:uncharacterized protein (DUF1697 family)
VTTFVALLRAVNLGSHKPIAMSALREFATSLGFCEVRTLLQTGNIVFAAKARSAKNLEDLLESKARARLALETDFFIRSAEEWKVLVEKNPFPDEAKDASGRLVVMFLKHAPKADALTALRASIRGPEVADILGKQAYIIYPEGIGRSRLTNAAIEAKLGTRATGRNWNTVLKIGALMEADGGREVE